MYARSDITALAKGNSYSRLQWEEVTVGQALALAQQPTQQSHPSSSQVAPRASLHIFNTDCICRFDKLAVLCKARAHSITFAL